MTTTRAMLRRGPWWLLAALACHPSSGAGPRPVASRADAADATAGAERGRVRAVGETGDVERALAMLLAANASDPATRGETLGLEVKWLAELGRCREASEVTTVIDRGGDAPARQAAHDARAECDRLEHAPDGAEMTAMRARFREAASLEAASPARAAAAYLDAWAKAPTLAAMLGAARAAKAARNAPLATEALERAVAFARRGAADPTPRIEAQPPASDLTGNASVVTIDGDRALLFMDGALAAGSDRAVPSFLLSVDLATAAVTTLEELPPGVRGLALSARRALVYDESHGALRLLTLGVDDLHTAQPVAVDSTYFGPGAFSPDGTRVAVQTSDGVAVVDAQTAKTLVTLPFHKIVSVCGFTLGGRALALGEANGVALYDTTTWKPLPREPSLDGDVVGLAADWFALRLRSTPNGAPDTVRVYDLAGRRVVREIHGHFQSVGALPLAPNGTELLTLSRSHSFAWNLATGARARLGEVLTTVSSNEQIATFTADSSRVVGYTSGAAVVYPTATLAKDVAVDGPIGGNGSALLGRGHVIYFSALRSITRVDLDARSVTSWDAPVPVDTLGISDDGAWLALTSSDAPGTGGPTDVVVLDARGRVAARVAAPSYDSYRFDGAALRVRTRTNEIVVDLATGKQTVAPRSDAPDAQGGPVRFAVHEDGEVVALREHGGKVTLLDGDPLASIEVGRDFAVVTSAAGASDVIGVARRARCRVGAAWLPLEACRATSSRSVVADVIARWR